MIIQPISQSLLSDQQSDQQSEQSALQSAGISQVRLAPNVMGIESVIDGSDALTGSLALDHDGLDLDQGVALNLVQTPIATGTEAAFTALWNAGQ